MIDTVGKEKPEDNLSYFVTSQEMRTGLFPKISIYIILITFKRANCDIITRSLNHYPFLPKI